MSEKNGMITIRVFVHNGYVNGTVVHEFKIEKEDWDEMSIEERDKLCLEVMWELIEWGYEEVETED